MDILFKQTPNYTKGVIAKRGYVLHHTLGSYAGAVEWLMNANRPSPTSAHYVIGRNEGEVTQLVKDTDDSWHAGIIDRPSEYALRYLLKNQDSSFVNPNRYLIGIEFASRYDIDHDGIIEPQEIALTDWQYRCAMAIMEKNKELIPITPTMPLISHQEISAAKSDDTKAVREELLKRLFSTPESAVMLKQQIKTKLAEVAALVEKLKFHM